MIINIASVHNHYEIVEKSLSDNMIYTLHSWMDTEVDGPDLRAKLSNELLSQDLSIQGGFLRASVMLVHAPSPNTFPDLMDLLGQHYYHARGMPSHLHSCTHCCSSNPTPITAETHIIVYCPNFINHPCLSTHQVPARCAPASLLRPSPPSLHTL